MYTAAIDPEATLFVHNPSTHSPINWLGAS
jgi:hypothetical protein